jgi:peptidoglycan/xylan/chitin deacetylase (PgdA/CDA1 family)
MHAGELTYFLRQNERAVSQNGACDATLGAAPMRLLPPGAWPSLEALDGCVWFQVLGPGDTPLPATPPSDAAAFFGPLIWQRGSVPFAPPFHDHPPITQLAFGRTFDPACAIWRADAVRAAGGFDPSFGEEAARALAIVLAAKDARLETGSAPLACRTRFQPPRHPVAAARAAWMAKALGLAGVDGPGPQAHAVLYSVAEALAAAAAVGIGEVDSAWFGKVHGGDLRPEDLAAHMAAAMEQAAGAPCAALAQQDPDLPARVFGVLDALIAAGAPARRVDAARLALAAKLQVSAARADGKALALTTIRVDLDRPTPPLPTDGGVRLDLWSNDTPLATAETVLSPGLSAAPAAVRNALRAQPVWRLGQIRQVRRSPRFWAALGARLADASVDLARLGLGGAVAALAARRASLLRDAHLDVLAPRAEAARAKPAPLGASVRMPVLMYHALAPTGAPINRYTVNLDRFIAQLDWLKDNGYRSLTAGQWAASVRAGRPAPAKRVVISFDDAYVSFRDLAWPELRTRGFTATMFAPTAFLSGQAEWAGAFSALDVMGPDDLRALAREGCEIGSHAVSHRYLTGLSPQDLYDEARHSRAALEAAIGKPVTLIAYPFGDADEAVRNAFSAAGYTAGFAAWGGVSTLADDPLNIQRMEVFGGDTLTDFATRFRT